MVSSTASIGSLPMPPLVVTVDLPRARVRVVGELDRESAHHLLDAVAVLAATPARRWQLDAGDVTFCDAEGLRALSTAHRLAAESGRVLRLVRAGRPITRLIGLMAEERPFPVPLPPQPGARPRPGDRTAGVPPRSRYLGCGAPRTV
ncbi:STAS domain-containing protein [Modestobacter italicus]|uniref:STAS domain-containing protein n=1 Tax=Modestobacter italicus (strain DSM 44449 / CECT 9708 / BC 501) TaxID=2732864 RepID=UPI001C9453C2|nr:STAS domain-containing protein [Modestobacter italicus]